VTCWLLTLNWLVRSQLVLHRTVKILVPSCANHHNVISAHKLSQICGDNITRIWNYVGFTISTAHSALVIFSLEKNKNEGVKWLNLYLSHYMIQVLALSTYANRKEQWRGTHSWRTHNWIQNGCIQDEHPQVKVSEQFQYPSSCLSAFSEADLQHTKDRDKRRSEVYVRECMREFVKVIN